MTQSVFPVASVVADDTQDFLKQSDPVAYAVWRLADGSRSIETLAGDAGISVKECWTALDRLADQNALSERVAPPSATPHPALLNRREAMSKVMMGALGATALMNAPQVFANRDISVGTNPAVDTHAAELKRPKEQHRKQASEQRHKVVEKRKASEPDQKAGQQKVVEQRKKQATKQAAEKRSKATQQREAAMEKKSKRAQQESKRKAVQ
ncbi:MULTISPECIES: hypothetical protein [Thalassolituus]|jgi:hypothetical protein|uniref:hypothetical protein n=1 Tax=Thalassolituus TaxID=187492 RepID=UPI0007CFF6E6|nr:MULTISPECIES: hypothetical protein [Thalassolituus]KZY96994.1 hypothetical protein A3746_21970 [Oleibacter sp. HI0075]KZY98636.1 hypothetical protein A3746_06525 [Oleibacter sp. HI0075]MAX87770.1 hypothetical protein [Oceanospirillaceae bacterium]|tara:strand:+ start:2075 stop:2704 length:630 start_codon:yes stop_codon:yes gene_type:complete